MLIHNNGISIIEIQVNVIKFIEELLIAIKRWKEIFEKKVETVNVILQSLILNGVLQR